MRSPRHSRNWNRFRDSMQHRSYESSWTLGSPSRTKRCGGTGLASFPLSSLPQFHKSCKLLLSQILAAQVASAVIP